MDDQQPNTNPIPDEQDESAVAMIRDKVARIYSDEPDSLLESQEADRAVTRSKHQQFMYELSSSGKDLATIQTEWHNYYIGLPESEKHEVWQEFYQSNTNFQATPVVLAESQSPDAVRASDEPGVDTEPIDTFQQLAEHKHGPLKKPRSRPAAQPRADQRSSKDMQAVIREKVSANGRLTAKHHLQSLLFGLGMGALVIFIFLFTFFNEVVIAPFIQPGRVAAATPVIVDASSISSSANPEVIIPKINVEIPVNYTETSTNENTIENDLESGVVHYPSTVMPGQDGNAAFFGHSSNNILNPGKYKFAFVLLHTLVPGDTFYLTYHGTVYIYKVISKNIVSPNDVAVLGPVTGQTATATLITCDPPGTSLNRLVVVGQQISPSPTTNTQPSPSQIATTATTSLPGNGPTLWSRVMSTTAGKVVLGLVGLAVVGYGVRKLHEFRDRS